LKHNVEAVNILQQVSDSSSYLWALTTLADLQFQASDFPSALKNAQRAKALVRGRHDLEQETMIAVMIVRIYNSILAKKKYRETTNTREHAARVAREAIGLCRQFGDGHLLASCLLTALQVFLGVGRDADAYAAGDEAAGLFNNARDERNEGYAFLLSGIAYGNANMKGKARERVKKALEVATRTGHVEVLEAAKKNLEILKEAQETVKDEKNAPGIATEAATESAAPQPAKALELAPRTPSVNVDLVKQQVMSMVKQIIGTSEEMHDDSPLMNVGLTSMSSAMLRDRLASDFKSVGMPFTLAFDYPSVNSIAEYICEQME
jgi:tetratricopeptide (TPR) repeat protein